jgi:hypothetical protein
MKSLSTATLSELRAIEQVAINNGNEKNMFNYIISAGTKYFEYYKGGKGTDGKTGTELTSYNRNTAACFITKKQYIELLTLMGQTHKNVTSQINLTAAEFEQAELIGDVFIDFKINLSNSLYKLGQYIGHPEYENNDSPNLFVSSHPLSAIADYGSITGSTNTVVAQAITVLVDKYPHETLLVLGILADFMGPYGWLMSSVIFAFDAKLYIDEERYFEAGVSGLFAAIPMLRRIPMFKNYSKAFFTNLGFKLEAEAAVKLTIAEE